jgi:hypothetical protein
VDQKTGQIDHRLSLQNRQLWVILLGLALVLPLSLTGSYRALRPASLLSAIAVRRTTTLARAWPSPAHRQVLGETSVAMSVGARRA